MKKNGRAFYNFKAYQENKLVRALDSRAKSGKSDEDNAASHVTHVAEDGARTWSY